MHRYPIKRKSAKKKGSSGPRKGKKPANKKLTEKQKRFVQEYLVDLNATQAAIRAGYSKRTAYKTGHENLHKGEIAAEIAKRAQKKADGLEITQERVLRELARLAFSQLNDFLEWDEKGNVKLKPSGELTANEAACISEISETVTEHGGTRRIKLYDKVTALTRLGQYLELFTDKLKVDGTLSVETIRAILEEAKK